MKLELHRISVGKLAFGAQTVVSGGVLTINKDELAGSCRTAGGWREAIPYESGRAPRE